jgi:hypothetical protein
MAVHELNLMSGLWSIMNHCYMWRHICVKFVELFLRISYHTVFWSPCIDNGSALNFVKKSVVAAYLETGLLIL